MEETKDYDSDESILTDDIETQKDEDIEPPKAEEIEPPTTRKKRAPIKEEIKLANQQAKDELKKLKADKRKNDRLIAKQAKIASEKADKVIVQQKEKVIYMLQNTDGSFDEFNPEEVTKSQIKAINQEKKNLKTELELGQKLPRLLSGKVKIPKERTEKQKAQTAILVARNKARAEQKRLNKKAETDLSVQQSVKSAVKEVLNKPKKQIQEEIKKEEIIQPLIKKFQYF